MIKENAVNLIKSGIVADWNLYRKENPNWKPDLRNIDFGIANLAGIDLRESDLRGSDLSNTSFDNGYNIFSLQITGATYNSDTKWPSDFMAHAYGAMQTPPRDPLRQWGIKPTGFPGG